MSLLIATIPFLAATPAQATALAWECDLNYSCYYMGYNGTGSRWVAPTAGCHEPPAFPGNSISSVYNRGHNNAYVHLYAKVSSSWVEIASFSPGAWGNLSGSSDNNADRVCITP
ncbi:peptidase inhibitor family I36 protein [Nonomuraea basaltis]|uniref:peptidase inhibitor family I36 protein n=1 Tax=Nonomuraea basaltis TaxID=2495887 RepID=UPI0014874225|nr:peptidase inhibitor family I36 protein [Nonomuraea basaltis]